MRSFRAVVFSVTVLALAACADERQSPMEPEGRLAPSEQAPLHAAPAGKAVEGSYIVVLKEGANARSVMAIAGIDPRFEYTPRR